MCGTPFKDAAAQPNSYPKKSLNLVVPFGAGGLPDQVARVLVEASKPYFPKPILIVNRPGGAGTVGGAEVVQARPDGYTMGLTTKGPMLVQPFLSNLPYNGPGDFQPVVKIVNPPLVFTVRANEPWKTLKDVVEFAKTNPGKVRVAHPGPGSLQQLTLETLKERAKVDLTGVPFSGGGGAMASAVLGGHVEATIIPPVVVLGHVKAGRLKILATFEENRNPQFSDVPTARELGWDVIGANPLYVFGPKGMPESAIRSVEEAFKKGMETARFKKFAEEKSLSVDYKGPKDLGQELQSDANRFGQLVKKLGLTKK